MAPDPPHRIRIQSKFPGKLFLGETGSTSSLAHPRSDSEFERATIRDRVLRRAGSRMIICDPSASGRPRCGLADRRSVKVPIANALRAALSKPHDTIQR